jgi:hypothetical protein
MLRIALAGTFAACLEQPLRRYLDVPCEIVVAGETEIVPLPRGVDVLISMALTAEMAPTRPASSSYRSPGPGSIASTAPRCRRARSWRMSSVTRSGLPSTYSAPC